MPVTLTQQQRADLQTKLNNNDVAGFYSDLFGYGDPYGRLGLAVTNNDGWQGKLANSFAEAGGKDNAVDVGYGSPLWFEINQEIAEAYWEAYEDNNGNQPTLEQVQDIHKEVYEDKGLDADDWLPNKPLNDSSDPDGMWDDFLTNTGPSDLWDDAFDTAKAGAGLAFPPYFTASALTDPNFLDQIGFAKNFYEALRGLDIGTLLDMVDDFDGNLPVSDLLEFLVELPQAVDGILNDIQWALDNPEAILAQLPDWLADLPIWDILGVGPGSALALGGLDPLIFDLDGDGIELVSIANSNISFDYWGDDYAEATGWVDADDGMLVWDMNESGTVDNVEEMFGSNYPLGFIIEDNWDQFTSEEHGFARLALHDLAVNGGDEDGMIDEDDAIWTELKIWQDLNQDGVSQTNEMQTLDQIGIESIDISNYALDSFSGLSNGGFERIIEGNTVTHSGTFTMTGNVTREVVDVWFNTDLRNTNYAGEFDIDPRALFLPTLRGYGQVADLHIAMSMDENLLESVQDFATSRSFEVMFGEFETVRSDVEAIALAWAGIDPQNLNGSQGEHGMYSALPQFYFLRKLTGIESEHLGSWFDQSPYMPEVDEGLISIDQSWNAAIDAFAARLLFQSGGSALFENGVSYNPFTDSFEGTFALSQDGLDLLETEASTHTDTLGFWNAVATFIDATMGLGNLSGTESGWLDDAVDGSTSGALSWADILDTLDTQIISGTSGNDILHGTRWDDEIGTWWGTDGDDVLYGYEGNDELGGGDGDDFLDGGAGNDVLRGGRGDDVYHYSSGHDVIQEAGGNDYGDLDIIEFASGITAGDITLYLAAMNGAAYTEHLVLTVEGHGSITIKNDSTYWSPYTQLVDELHFSNNTMISIDDMDITVHGTALNDSLSTNIWSTSGSFGIYGYGGDDALYAAYGVSTTLDGGAGDDELNGSSGDDIFIVSAGNDVAYGGGGNNTIVIPEGYTMSDVSFARSAKGGIGDYNDAIITVAGLGAIVVEDLFSNHSSTLIQTLTFADGLTANVDLTDAIYTVVGKSGNDMIYGNWSWGQQDDIYLFGSGQDVIQDGYGGTDKVVFADDILPEDITLYRQKDPFNFIDSLVIEDTEGNRMYFNQQFHQYYDSNRIETLEFADQTVLTLANLDIETRGTSGNDSISGIEAGAGINDTIYGYDGSDFLSGGSGNDLLVGGAGYDYLYGDDGIDTIAYTSSSSGINVNLATYTVSNDGNGSSDSLWSIENIIGSNYADTFIGSNVANSYYGGGGADAFVFKGETAFNAVDTIEDFSEAQGDFIDISDVLSDFGYVHGTDVLADWLSITDNGTDSFVAVDQDGAGNAYTSFAQIIKVENVSDIDNGNIIVV